MFTTRPGGWRLPLKLSVLAASVAALAFSQALSPPATEKHGAVLRGRVFDPSGRPVPEASISIRNILTGTSRTAQSTQDGVFTLPDIAPGRYTLSAAGHSLASEIKSVSLSEGQELDVGEVKLSLLASRQQVDVVSASRVTELDSQSPTKVLAVTKEEMRNKGFERVGDVLSEVPGVVTRAQSFGVGIAAGEQIDGMDSKETLVLVDGLPFAGARGISGGLFDLNQQDVGRLERVEVVKGAASALYGTDALGGVINLITREPSDALNIDATVSGGSLGMLDGRAGIGGRWKNLTALADIESHYRDAYTLIPQSISTVGADEDRQDLLAKLRYTFSPRAALGFTSTAYRAHAHGSGSTLGVDPASPYSSTPTALRSNESTQTFALTGDFVPSQSTTWQTRLYSSRFIQNSASRLLNSNVEGPQFDLGNLREDYNRADSSIGQAMGSRNYLQAGYEWVQDRYRGDNRIVGGSEGQQLTTNDIWLQDRAQPVRNLTLTIGGRYQHNSSYGGHVVPKLGVVYRLNDHLALRAAFGLGFRAPNPGELFYHLLHLEYGYQVIGNPTLRPETSRSFSGGATFNARRYRLSLNLFRNSLSNLINYSLVCNATGGQNCSGAALESLLAGYGIPPSFAYDGSGAALFTYVQANVDRAYTQGFDIDGRMVLTPTLAFSGAYTYLEAVDSINHAWLSNRNRHQAHLKLEYDKPRWGLLGNIRGTFFSKWPTTDGAAPQAYAYGYAIWNIYASKSLGHGLQLFGSVDNLADSRDKKLDQASASFDRVDYGRTFRIGMRFNLRHNE